MHEDLLSSCQGRGRAEKFAGGLTVLVDAMNAPMIQIHKLVRMGCAAALMELLDRPG